MGDWLPGFLLPNVRLEAPIEAKHIALVQAHDERVVSYASEHPNWAELISSFTDAFGVAVAPSLIVIRRDAPAHVFHMGNIGSFRDLVAMSVIPKRQAEILTYGTKSSIYANTFDLYPWTLDKNDQYLTMSTPAVGGLHQVAEFHGQVAPEVARVTLSRSDLDQPLLTETLRRWERIRKGEAVGWDDRRLFRALNMAFHAARMPAGAEITKFDIGRSIALWVSAFEILVHPGGTDKTSISLVFDVLERTNWVTTQAARKAFVTTTQGVQRRRTLASWLYQRLYRARNDFMHGNPVRWGSLREHSAAPMIVHFAAPLFRLCLASVLNLQPPEVLDADKVGLDAASRSHSARLDWRFDALRFERCLARARQKKAALAIAGASGG